MAIELISTVKPINNGQFPIVEANDIKGGYYSVESYDVMLNIPPGRRLPGMLCYVVGDKIYKLSDDMTKWNEFNIEGGSSSSSQSNGIWIGVNPPPNGSNYVLWIDTSDGTIDESFSSSVINEFKSILTFLTERIVKLESKVAYLEQFHGEAPDIPDGPDVPDNPTTNDTILVNENGFILVNENGQILCGNVNNETVDSCELLVNENNQILINENGQELCFQLGSVTELTDKILKNENNVILVNENNEILCLDVYNMLLTNEDNDVLVNENNEYLKL